MIKTLSLSFIASSSRGIVAEFSFSVTALLAPARKPGCSPIVFTKHGMGKEFFALAASFVGSVISSRARAFMVLMMSTRSNKFQIFNSVVRFMSVFMVNMFLSLQRPAKMLFHYISMLKISLAIYMNYFIPNRLNIPTSSGLIPSYIRVPIFHKSFIVRLAKASCHNFRFTTINSAKHCNLLSVGADIFRAQYHMGQPNVY